MAPQGWPQGIRCLPYGFWVSSYRRCQQPGDSSSHGKWPSTGFMSTAHCKSMMSRYLYLHVQTMVLYFCDNSSISPAKNILELNTSSHRIINPYNLEASLFDNVESISLIKDTWKIKMFVQFVLKAGKLLNRICIFTDRNYSLMKGASMRKNINWSNIHTILSVTSRT